MKQWILYLIAVVVVLSLGIFGGWKLHKTLRPCPVITHDTISFIDSVEHHIPDIVPWYIQGKDSIVYRDTGTYHIADTAKILADYFAYHTYPVEWKDTNLVVNLTDIISENKYIDRDFSYKILRPQTIINNTEDNSITYNRYLTFGLGVPIKEVNYINLETTMNFEKWYVGAQYIPKLNNSFGVRAGVTLIKFRKKK